MVWGMTRQTVQPVRLTDTSTATCPTCGQLWRWFKDGIMAVSLTPVSHRWETAHYVIDGVRYTAGEGVPYATTDDGGPDLLHAWVCGTNPDEHAVVLATPAWERVPCMAGGIPDPLARAINVHASRRLLPCTMNQQTTGAPAPDLYVNPRHGGGCECCGHQGTHLVRRDLVGAPLCVRTYGLAAIRGARS